MAFETLKSRGVKFEAPEILEFPWGYAARFQDPDGNRHAEELGRGSRGAGWCCGRHFLNSLPMDGFGFAGVNSEYFRNVGIGSRPLHCHRQRLARSPIIFGSAISPS